MKNLFIFTALALSLQLSANELAWVDEQIEAIKPPREGIKDSQFSHLKDPFIFLEKNKTPKKEDKEKKRVSSIPSSAMPTAPAKSETRLKNKNATVTYKKLTLLAVINKSALISGKWYKLGEKVSKYTLSEVNKSFVILSKGKKTLMLSTKTQSSNLKFKEK